MHPVTPRIKLSPQGLDVVSTLNEDFGICLQHVERFACSSGEHGRESSGESVCGRSDTLMRDYVVGAGTETASSTEWACKRPDDHVNLGSIDVLGLRETAASSSEYTKRPSLIEDKTELVAKFELDLGFIRQVIGAEMRCLPA